MRLDKFLVECGLGSRSEVKQILKKKQILVNGQIETSPKTTIDEQTDQISYQGFPLVYEEFVYYLLNKPKGVVSATEDAHHRTVLDLLDDLARQKAVFPVGRLDKDTHGLLILTNDGQLAHQLLSPKKHVDKVYQALVEGVMTREDILSFERGIELSDHRCLPAELTILSSDTDKNRSKVAITIREGKFHQVKRMVKACGKTVLDLQRTHMANLSLDATLGLGQWRRLRPDEVQSLKKAID